MDWNGCIAGVKREPRRRLPAALAFVSYAKDSDSFRTPIYTYCAVPRANFEFSKKGVCTALLGFTPSPVIKLLIKQYLSTIASKEQSLQCTAAPAALNQEEINNLLDFGGGGGVDKYGLPWVKLKTP